MLLAIALATAAAFAWSINNVLAAAAVRSVRPTTGALVSLMSSAVCIIPIGLFVDAAGFAKLGLEAVAWFAAIGFFNFPGGRYCTYVALRHIGASRAIMMRNATPVLIVIMALFFFHERPSLQVLVGGLLIVAGLYVSVEPRREPALAAARASEADEIANA